MLKVIFAIIIPLFAFSSVLLSQPKIHVDEGTTLDFGSSYTGSKVDRICKSKQASAVTRWPRSGTDRLPCQWVRCSIICKVSSVSIPRSEATRLHAEARSL